MAFEEMNPVYFLLIALLIVIGIGVLALKTRDIRRRAGFDAVLGEMGTVTYVNEDDKSTGQIEVAGEIWKVKSAENLKVKQLVRILSHKGLTLNVRPEKES